MASHLEASPPACVTGGYAPGSVRALKGGVPSSCGGHHGGEQDANSKGSRRRVIRLAHSLHLLWGRDFRLIELFPARPFSGCTAAAPTALPLSEDRAAWERPPTWSWRNSSSGRQGENDAACRAHSSVGMREGIIGGSGRNDERGTRKCGMAGLSAGVGEAAGLRDQNPHSCPDSPS